MIRPISTASLALVLGACATFSVPSTPAAPVADSLRAAPLDGGCEALRLHFPIAYHGNSDTPDTVGRIRAANASFKGSCP